MTPKDNISAELMELSPVLAGIPKVNVFKLPEGYFETLAINSLLKDNTVKANLTGLLSNVPEGYFYNLPTLILQKIKASTEVLDETKELSTVVGEIGNTNVFTVPTGYFNGLTQHILDATKGLASLPAGNVFTAPEGYFEHLSTNIMARIKEQNMSEVYVETNGISETVARIGQANVYTVPTNYFDSLAGKVLKNTASQPQARVVSMKSRFTAWKYAAAAAIVGILGFSLFFMLNKNEPANVAKTETMMAAKEIIKTNSFENELNSISDAAIVDFLEAKGEDVEAALVASLIDEKNLPDATDYLLDDQALDNILKTVELNN